MTLCPLTCPLERPDACGVLLETDDQGQFKQMRGNPDHSWSQGYLCGGVSASSAHGWTCHAREGDFASSADW